MKKILLTLVVCILGFSCIGCGLTITYEEAVEKSEEQTSGDNGESYFTTLITWEENRNTHQIVYANDTKVKYLIISGYNRSAITPLYNSDGTVQVYDGD